MRFVRRVAGVLAVLVALVAAAAFTAASLDRSPQTTKAPTATSAPHAADRSTATATAAARYGWTNLLHQDDFNGSTLDPNWGVYDSPGHEGKGIRSPARISVSNGVMTMTGTADGTTAGMSWRHPQKYGRWEIRARFPAGCGCYHPVLILWPAAVDWPAGGEIDYAEVFGADRRTLHFFLHYSADNQQISKSVPVDMTQWHNYAVEWTADHITGYVDGQPFFHTDRSDVQPPAPMTQTVQLDWFPGEGAGTGAALEVDWAAMYAP
jgi:licheninase